MNAPSPRRTAATAPACMVVADEVVEPVAAAAAEAADEASAAREEETEAADARIPAKAVEAADRTESAPAVFPAACRPGLLAKKWASPKNVY